MIFYIVQWFWRPNGPWQSSQYLEGQAAMDKIGERLDHTQAHGSHP